MPDDSGITTRLPSICVDYLSHDWAEDDVWTSWKAMTKHKSEIANGVRLENASWRTWAKQRGNLKTISPETLNWCASLHLHHQIEVKLTRLVCCPAGSRIATSPGSTVPFTPTLKPSRRPSSRL